eukprot:gb/GECH01009290.1/.p1 GENE.gb/GECH01009290.1/~~gb/GECH01009290.1/.p1  ORF type:complete len:174 (+),score=42.87 gb/GECH01009290.1/:1-522(+)
MPARDQRIRKNKKKLREEIYNPAENERTNNLHQKMMNLIQNPEIGTPPVRPEIEQEEQEKQERRQIKQMRKAQDREMEDSEWKEAQERKRQLKQKEKRRQFKEKLKAGKVKGAKPKKPKAPKGCRLVRKEHYEKRYQYHRPVKVVEYKPVKIEKKPKKRSSINWGSFVSSVKY